jgi:hypothetical protein
MNKTTGPNSIAQEKFIDDCGADKMSDVISVGTATSANMATSSLQVGKGSVLRVRVGAATFIAFSNDKTALDAATIDAAYVASPCIELPAAGTYVIASPAKWARASADPVRKELITA